MAPDFGTAGYAEIASWLRDRGNPNELEASMDATALHFAKDAETARQRLEAGADRDARDKDGATPLHWAAWNGKAEIIAAFQAAGIDVYQISSVGGQTPLHAAAEVGEAEFVFLTARHGVASTV